MILDRERRMLSIYKTTTLLYASAFQLVMTTLPIWSDNVCSRDTGVWSCREDFLRVMWYHGVNFRKDLGLTQKTNVYFQ